MNNLTTFNFNNNTVRTQLIDGQPYFCMKDCCMALGLSKATKSQVRLSEKGVLKTHTLTKGGKQELVFINEPNLYRLIFRSNKPQAQAFANWAYSDVLPTIRKTGMYISPAQQELALSPLPYDLSQDKNALKVIGGMMKRCCSSAVKETLTTDDDTATKAVAMLIDYITNKKVEQKARDMFYAWKLSFTNSIKQIIE